MVKTEGIRKDGQCGEIMLEASIIMVSVVMLLVGLLSINFMFYERAMLNSIATEIADNIAENYKYGNIFQNIEDELPTNPKDLPKRNRLRHWSPAFVNIAEGRHNIRAEKYARKQLVARSLGFNTNSNLITIDANGIDVNTDADIFITDCEIERTGVGRAYIKVTVCQKADFFFSEFAEFVGFVHEDSNGRYLFSATAKSECDDLIGYTSTVNVVQLGADKLSPFAPLGWIYVDIKNLREYMDEMKDE